MSGGAKLCMRAFKMLATTGAVIWTLLAWENISANWEDISDEWGG